MNSPTPHDPLPVSGPVPDDQPAPNVIEAVPTPVAALAVETPLRCTSRGRAAKNRRERERKARRRAENRRTLALEKAKGCWLCMRRDLAAEKLHFHHLDPRKKRDCVAHLINRSVSTFLEELCECRLICCGCHEEHHAVLHSEAWRKGGCYDI
jgi:hypothetical protein